jgi:hypothetical protein
MNRRRGVIVWLGWMVMLILVSVSFMGCEPSFDLVVENQTAQALTIYVNDGLLGNVEPGGEVTRYNTPGDISEFSIVAKSPQGETVFSKKFSRQQMQQVDSDTFKVVITTQSP